IDGSRYGLLETIKDFAREHLASRYGILGTIQEFASERLKERDDVAATTRRHCDYFFDLAKTTNDKLLGPEQGEWMRRAEADIDNLRAAIAFALCGEIDPTIAVRFEQRLMRFRLLRGYATEGRKNVRAVLGLPGIQEANRFRANALYVGGVLASDQGDYTEATEMLTECLAIRRGLSAPIETGAALSELATLHLQRDDLTKAAEYEAEAIVIFRDINHPLGEGLGLITLGQISMRQGDDIKAQEFFERCLAIARGIEHRELEADCERDLGGLALKNGNLQAANARFTRSLKICQEAHDRRGEAITLWHLGRADAAGGDNELACRRLSEALRALQAFEMNSEALDCLADYASLIEAVGQIETAVSLYAAVAAAREMLGLPGAAYRDAEMKSRLTATRANLGDQAFDAAWSVGRTWSRDEAIEHALASAAATAEAS
ncbi:MAG TPA: tetratricopeptide repeat protein, partial [Burkholderiales bacterium]|nr:tetratricopeptide repeat protein [Burkholderiales bacterium]